MIDTHILLKVLSIKGIGSKTALKLLEDCDSNVSSDKDLVKYLTYFSQLKLTHKLEEHHINVGIEKANQIILGCEKHNISFLDFQSSLYPLLLKRSEYYPLIFSYKGNIDLLRTNCIAMIGRREPTEEGYKSGYACAKLLGKKGLTVVSGLASGCDTAVHLGCLAGKGKTIAVLANSLDVIYPSKNKKLAEDILVNDGLLMSVLCIGDRLNSGAFLERNKMLVGISKSIIAIEIKNAQSGTLYSINNGIMNGRKVGCLCYKHVFGNGTLKISKESNIIFLKNSKDVFDFVEHH